MAAARLLRPLTSTPLRFTHTIAHRHHPPPHEHSNPSSFLGSWKIPPPTSDPREAEARLDRLRKDYAKQIKQLRREYSYEMDLQRAEKQRKDEIQREAARVANEERKAVKAAAAKTRAAERKAFEENFREMIMTEKAQKLEYWRAREARMAEKKIEKKTLLRQQSSLWIAEENLDKRILEAIVDTTPL